MALWSRYPGRFGEKNYPWRVFYCANALFGSAQSPVICENTLFAACKGDIEVAKGCQFPETCNQVIQNSYVDNLLLGKQFQHDDELSLFQLYSDLKTTLLQGSLALQENVIPFFWGHQPRLV